MSSMRGSGGDSNSKSEAKFLYHVLHSTPMEESLIARNHFWVLERLCDQVGLLSCGGMCDLECVIWNPFGRE